MKLVRLRLANFRSFSPGPTVVELTDMTFLLGPNGAGKTAALQALARMFGLDPAQRRIKRSDFHVPANEAPEDVPEQLTLWIEADFEFPELEQGDADEAELPAVPGNFAHMQLVAAEGPAQVRFRLKATIDQYDEIEESFTFVISEDEDGNPTEESRVSKQDRSAIQVHYLPARRDPADHVSYSANALLGRVLRSADWSAEREEISTLTEQIGDELRDNAAIGGIAAALTDRWGGLHKGTHYTNPSVSFGRNEIEISDRFHEARVGLLLGRHQQGPVSGVCNIFEQVNRWVGATDDPDGPRPFNLANGGQFPFAHQPPRSASR